MMLLSVADELSVVARPWSYGDWFRSPDGFDGFFASGWEVIWGVEVDMSSLETQTVLARQGVMLAYYNQPLTGIADACTARAR